MWILSLDKYILFEYSWLPVKISLPQLPVSRTSLNDQHLIWKYRNWRRSLWKINHAGLLNGGKPLCSRSVHVLGKLLDASTLIAGPSMGYESISNPILETSSYPWQGANYLGAAIEVSATSSNGTASAGGAMLHGRTTYLPLLESIIYRFFSKDCHG